MSKFRLNAKTFFLTYPKCPIPKEIVKAQIEDLKSPIEGIYAEELHEDGTPHIHVYIKFETKKNFTSPNCFDLTYEGKQYHGNYQTCKNPDATKNYVKKSNNFIETIHIEKEEENIFECARRMDEEEFILECMERKITHAYCHKIWTMTRKDNTLHEDSAGMNLINKEISTTKDLKYFDTNTKQKQYTKKTLRQIVEESQSSSLDLPVVEKQPGQSTTCPNQSCFAATLTHSKHLNPIYTNQSSSTTWLSDINQEKHNYTWWTENNLDQYIADTPQSIFQQDWLNASQPTDFLSCPTIQHLKEELQL